MKVITRSGDSEDLSLDKIKSRIVKLSSKFNLNIDADKITLAVVNSIYDNIKTSELDEESSRIAAMDLVNPDMLKLAGIIAIDNHHKNTSSSFVHKMELLYAGGILNDNYINYVRKNANIIQSTINYELDFDLDYFGYRTLERAYLLRTNEVIVERPQDLFMREALAIRCNNISEAMESYMYLSQGYYTHATPTLFHAGTIRQQLSSCYLLSTSDSVEGLYKSVGDCAKISQYAGGIGLAVSNVRSKGSEVKGTNGKAGGLVPYLKVLNETARHINQCFVGDTMIYTDLGPITIDSICVGNKVLTNDGSYKEVLQIHKRNIQEPILQIENCKYTTPVRATKVHNFLVLKNNNKNPIELLKSRVILGHINEEFTQLQNVTTNDYLVYSIPKENLNLDSNLVDNKINTYTDDYIKFLGVLSSPAISYDYNTNIVSIRQYYRDIVEILENLAISNMLPFTSDEKYYYVDISRLGLKSNFFLNINNKAVIDPFIYSLSIAKTKCYLEGYLKGCYKVLDIHYSRYEITVNDNILREGITFLYLKLGFVVEGFVYGVLKGLVLPNFNKYDHNSAGASSFWFNNKIYIQVKSIRELGYSGDVYDLTIDTNSNYTTSVGLVHNSGRRPGSFAIYTEPWHSDIYDFLDMKRPHGKEEFKGRDLFYALWIPDLFMKCVKDDSDWYLMCPSVCDTLVDSYGATFEKNYKDFVSSGKYTKRVKARDLWKKILETQIETGTPYMCYKDACNYKSNQNNLGTIRSSNLCVAPETMILTSKGTYPIAELVDKPLEVWNGEQWSSTIVKQTGVQQSLLTVTLSGGKQVECTKHHKFYIVTGKRPNEYPMLKKIEAKDLNPGMRLIKTEFPVIEDGLKNFPYPYEHGLYTADGTLENKKENVYQCSYKSIDNSSFCTRHINMYKEKNVSEYCQAGIGKGTPRLSLYGEKKKLLKYITTRIEVCEEDSSGRLNCRLPTEIFPKFVVPLNYNLDIKLRWFEGLCDGDGSINKSEGSTGVQISSIHKEFLTKVLYMLQTMGCDPKITIMNISNKRLLPTHKGYSKLYDCKDCYRLLLTSWDVSKLYDLGFRPKRLEITGLYPKNNTKRYTLVESVVDNGRVDDTYCFTEPLRGMGVFNGLLLGNCSEIVQYSSDDEISNCNLASIALPKFVVYKDGIPTVDYKLLENVSRIVTRSLNSVIDVCYYPLPETKYSNLRNRPLGIGVQGLAYLFMKLGIAFESKEAQMVNLKVFETIYYGSLCESNDMAKLEGPYETFAGSEYSKGKFQFDLWKECNPQLDLQSKLSGDYDWESLRSDIMKYGLRNSLLTTCMPTASTSQILGNSECIEAITSNLYSRKVLAGEFIVANPYLIKDLSAEGLWNKDTKDLIQYYNGSIANIPYISDHIKSMYKTVYEISQKSVINMSADRGLFIDQSQSLNIFLKSPNMDNLTAMHFYGWSAGLKTGMYYLRSPSASGGNQITIDESRIKQLIKQGDSQKESKESISSIKSCPYIPGQAPPDCESCSG